MPGFAETRTLIGMWEGVAGEEQVRKRRHQKETDAVNSWYTLVGY